MFFIFGIDQGEKEIKYEKLIICNECRKYGRYQVYMTYMCFSLFFIPIIRWGRKYYVKTTCCNTLYELNQEVGKRLKNGENIEITEKDLTIIQSNNGWQFHNYGSEKRCINCGYVGSQEFEYCPKCGRHY